MALNILVVDDSAVMRAMILRTLQMAGVPLGEAFQATNGAEGLQALQDNWVDLAIVDINMPVMDGEEMVGAMRDDPELATIPIIVVSTEGSQTRINRLIATGVEFIHKPFAPETVRAVVNQLIGGRYE